MLESRFDGNQAEGFGEEYEDEYDDTYDDNAMGEKEPDLDEVLLTKESLRLAPGPGRWSHPDGGRRHRRR